MEEFKREILVSKNPLEIFPFKKPKDTFFLQKLKDFRTEIFQTHNQFTKEINELELNLNKFEDKNPFKFNIKENFQNHEVVLLICNIFLNYWHRL